MKCGVRFYLAGTVLLLALAGCGRSFLQFGERAAWRHEAEVTCLKSGAVKIGAGVVQMQPIEGPGMCGADFPLKVALLGESTAMSYADDLRPPAGIPNASAGAAALAGERAAYTRRRRRCGRSKRADPKRQYALGAGTAAGSSGPRITRAGTLCAGERAARGRRAGRPADVDLCAGRGAARRYSRRRRAAARPRRAVLSAHAAGL